MVRDMWVLQETATLPPFILPSERNMAQTRDAAVRGFAPQNDAPSSDKRCWPLQSNLLLLQHPNKAAAFHCPTPRQQRKSYTDWCPV